MGTQLPVKHASMQGLINALEAKANTVAIFPAASEEFSQKNLNCSVHESLMKFEEVAKSATAAGVLVRGYDWKPGIFINEAEVIQICRGNQSGSAEQIMSRLT